MTARRDGVATGAVPLTCGSAVVFRVGEVGYRWDDVFAHARRRGAWQALQTHVREAQACQRMVVDEGLTPPVDEERAAATGFRYERRLYAAQDLEAWLDERGLTVAQWRDYIRGVVLRRRHEPELVAIMSRYPPTEQAVEHACGAWGVCSGVFARWAQELAARGAAAHAVWEADATGGDPPRPERLDALDALYERFAERAATPERLQATVTARALDWVQVDFDQTVFGNEDAAREALLCVRDDGWSLAEAARAAGTAVHRRSVFLEEVDGAARHQLLRARGGDLVGPLLLPEGPTLAHVRHRVEPSLHAPDVRARAVTELVDEAVAREVDDRVRWLPPL